MEIGCAVIDTHIAYEVLNSAFITTIVFEKFKLRD